MKTKVLVPLLAIFILMGCVIQKPINQMSTEEKAYKILSSSLSVYNLTMESVSEFQKERVISPETRANINGIAGKYRLAHIVASRALYAYKRLSSPEGESQLMAALDEAQKAFNDFLSFVEPIIRRGVK